MSHARYMLAGASLLLSCSNAASAASVGFDPTPVNVGVGATFTVDIVARGVTELAGGTIDLEFDSALLTINSVAIDPRFDFLPDAGGPAAGDKWPGISFDVFANSPASGDFPIATLSLTALGPGSSSLMILGSSAFFSATSQIAPSLSAATVNAVPLPAPLWLFGSALLASARLRRRSRTPPFTATRLLKLPPYCGKFLRGQRHGRTLEGHAPCTMEPKITRLRGLLLCGSASLALLGPADVPAASAAVGCFKPLSFTMIYDNRMYLAHRAGNLEIDLGPPGFDAAAVVNCDHRFVTTRADLPGFDKLYATVLGASLAGKAICLEVTDDADRQAFPGRCSIIGAGVYVGAGVLP